MLGGGVNALVTERPLRFANIALGELRTDEAQEVMRLDMFNLFR